MTDHSNIHKAFQREVMTDALIDEALPLVQAHHQEVMPYPDVTVNIDKDKYRAMEQAGCLRCYTVREKGELIGYANFFITDHPHYSHTIQALCDVVYIKPSYRNTGIQFIRWCDLQLSLEDIQEIHYTVQKRFDYSQLLTRMGYELNSYTFTRQLNDRDD